MNHSIHSTLSYSNSEESGAVVGCGESGLACAATPPQNHLLRKLQNGVSGVSGVEPLRIVCDSREQAPFTFAGFAAVVEVAGLEAGDYSLAGFVRRVAIERKSIQDLVGCLTGERPRFERELQRLKAMDAAAVVVEQPQSVLRLGHFRSRMDAGAAWQSCLALSMRYRIPFWFCDSRADAEAVTFNFLRHFARDRWRELQALRLAPTMTPQARPGHRTGNDTDQTPDTPQERTEGKANSTAPTATATGAGT